MLRKLVVMRKRTIVIAGFAGLLALALTSVALAQTGNAHWYNQDAHEGRFSVQTQVADGTQRIVAARMPVDITLDEITSLDFHKKITEAGGAAWDPLIVLGIDLDGDGKYSAQEYRWQMETTSDPDLLNGDTFIQCEAAAPATVDATFVPVDAYAEYNCYAPNSSGMGYAPFYNPLAVFQSGTTAGATGITGQEKVLSVKVHIGGSSNFVDETALVDLVELNGDVILDEPNNSKTSFQVVGD